MSKAKIANAYVRIHAYDVIARAVEEGVAYGWTRAHKHTDSPTEEAARCDIREAVLNALCEVLDFGHED